MQFALSVVLIIWTTVVYTQINFLQERDLGFDKEYLVYVPLRGDLLQQYEAARQELLQYPGIQNVSVTSHVPTGIYWNGSNWDWEGKHPDADPLVTYFNTDYDFLDTFEIEMAQGIFYLRERTAGSSDSKGQVVIANVFA